MASLFNTKLLEPETLQEKEKAFHDILVSVKESVMNTIPAVWEQM